ncbi:MAG TPA: hypothetical protein DEB25_02835 [Desulfobulbaceae bacterium]|nr:hypothetical protein [Desulfobulbaceae bacterium]
MPHAAKYFRERSRHPIEVFTASAENAGRKLMQQLEVARRFSRAALGQIINQYATAVDADFAGAAQIIDAMAAQPVITAQKGNPRRIGLGVAETESRRLAEIGGG